MDMEHLTQDEKKALSLFKQGLLRMFPERVEGLKLFGSKARGEATKHSDVDVIVVMKDGTWQDSWPIHKVASEVSLETDVDLSIKVVTPSLVRRLKEVGSPLMSNIDQDGIEL